MHVQKGWALQPNRPGRIIRVSDLNMIDYCQTFLSSKHAYRTPPVLLKNIERTPRVTSARVILSTQRVAYPVMHHMHAQGRVPGALLCTFLLLHVFCAQPCTSPNQPLSIPIQSWLTIRELQTQPGAGPSWAYSPYVTLKSDSNGGKNEQSETKQLCPRVCVLIRATEKGGCGVRAVVTVAPPCMAKWTGSPP